jgi:hypothetical protein
MTDPPIIIGMDCIAWTPNEETKNEMISADPTDNPAKMAHWTPSISKVITSDPPSLIYSKKIEGMTKEGKKPHGKTNNFRPYADTAGHELTTKNSNKQQPRAAATNCKITPPNTGLI